MHGHEQRVRHEYDRRDQVGFVVLTTRYCVLMSSDATENVYAPVELVSSVLPVCVKPAVVRIRVLLQRTGWLALPVPESVPGDGQQPAIGIGFGVAAICSEAGFSLS